MSHTPPARLAAESEARGVSDVECVAGHPRGKPMPAMGSRERRFLVAHA
jgi:hypothetical protein